MTNTMFSGPLAQELTDFLEWRGGAGHGSRSILRQLQTFDRFTQVTVSSSRLIDETFARAWLASAPGRGNNTRRSRYFLLRRICFSWQIDSRAHFSRRRRCVPDTCRHHCLTSTTPTRFDACSRRRPICAIGIVGIPVRSARIHYTRFSCCW